MMRAQRKLVATKPTLSIIVPNGQRETTSFDYTAGIARQGLDVDP